MSLNPRKSKRIRIGRTLAHRRFERTLHRTRGLLEIGLAGIGSYAQKADDFLKKLPDIKGIPGPVPKDWEEHFETEETPDGDVGWIMDRRTAHLLRYVFKMFRKEHKTLRFHLYSILTVYVWGAFETYLTMLFEELFAKHPEMLRTDQQVTFRDIIERRDDPLKLLIERELNRLGHFALDDWLQYLDDKLNVCFDVQEREQLAQLYLVRNIIAHNTGLIRPDLRDKLPITITVRDNEIRVTKAFLLGMLDTIKTAEYQIETQVVSKFFGNKRTPAESPNAPATM